LDAFDNRSGFVESTQDALLVFQACRNGLFRRIRRRLVDRERRLIRSGSIFVYDEHESGIKRWTDGRLWSPSRVILPMDSLGIDSGKLFNLPRIRKENYKKPTKEQQGPINANVFG
jgi:hypothetical protein